MKVIYSRPTNDHVLKHVIFMLEEELKAYTRHPCYYPHACEWRIEAYIEDWQEWTYKAKVREIERKYIPAY